MHTPRIPQPRTSKTLGGFTLIELLIVVAIIAILAAIAVPNFLGAQVRSKVARVKGDMRTMATGLEAYHVDHNRYPYDGYRTDGQSWLPQLGISFWYIPYHISTPVAYLSTAIFHDPFREAEDGTNPGLTWQNDNIRYTSVGSTWGTQFGNRTGRGTTPGADYEKLLGEFGGWRLSSAGPDRTYGPNGWVIPSNPVADLPHPYDPSNGTVSDGDILRTQKSTTGYLNAGA